MRQQRRPVGCDRRPEEPRAGARNAGRRAERQHRGVAETLRRRHDLQGRDLRWQISHHADQRRDHRTGAGQRGRGRDSDRLDQRQGRVAGVDRQRSHVHLARREGRGRGRHDAPVPHRRGHRLLAGELRRRHLLRKCEGHQGAARQGHRLGYGDRQVLRGGEGRRRRPLYQAARRRGTAHSDRERFLLPDRHADRGRADVRRRGHQAFRGGDPRCRAGETVGSRGLR